MVVGGAGAGAARRGGRAQRALLFRRRGTASAAVQKVGRWQHVVEGTASAAVQKVGHSERCCSEGGAVAARGGGSWLLPLDHSGSQRCSGIRG
eukprot:COSAG02_NODE_4076_length_5827_cov_4.514839_2_plen_93_part_00